MEGKGKGIVVRGWRGGGTAAVAGLERAVGNSNRGKVATLPSRAVSIRDVFSPAGERITVSLIWNSREVSQPTRHGIDRSFDEDSSWRFLRFVGNLSEKYRSTSCSKESSEDSRFLRSIEDLKRSDCFDSYKGFLRFVVYESRKRSIEMTFRGFFEGKSFDLSKIRRKRSTIPSIFRERFFLSRNYKRRRILRLGWKIKKDDPSFDFSKKSRRSTIPSIYRRFIENDFFDSIFRNLKRTILRFIEELLFIEE